MLMTEDKIGKSYLHTLCRAEEVDHIFTRVPLPEGVRTRMQNPATQGQ
jgi:DeoR/GlpR family transcriptional regulator of sugar metabolism